VTTQKIDNKKKTPTPSKVQKKKLREKTQNSLSALTILIEDF
jgi:hypothetical protein